MIDVWLTESKSVVNDLLLRLQHGPHNQLLDTTDTIRNHSKAKKVMITTTGR